MILPIIAAAGSVLVLTQSSITAPLRDALTALAEGADIAARARADLGSPGRADRFVPRAFRLGAKLASCPMCAGFWLGLTWAAALGSRGVVRLALGFAGSLASALLVALWLALSEAHASLALWRYLKTPPKGMHVSRWDLAKRMRSQPGAIACPEPGCEAVSGLPCRE